MLHLHLSGTTGANIHGSQTGSARQGGSKGKIIVSELQIHVAADPNLDNIEPRAVGQGCFALGQLL